LKKLLLMNRFNGNNDWYSQKNDYWQIHLRPESVIPTTAAFYALSAQYIAIILRSTVTILLRKLDRLNYIVNSSDYVESNERIFKEYIELESVWNELVVT
jgi:hypothetical protein